MARSSRAGTRTRGGASVASTDPLGQGLRAAPGGAERTEAGRPVRGSRRHLSVAALTVATVLLFWLTRTDWHWMHAWNRAFADASLVLLAITLAIGPLARLWTPAARWLVWRRELGIWTVFAALGHVLIVLVGWVEWDLGRLFYSFNLFKRDWALDQGFALANLLGIVTLGYAVVQLATSNDASVRLLGGPGWKFVQQGAYTLYALAALHTAYFLFFHFVSFHRPVPPPNWLQGPFLLLVAALFALQTAAFVATIRRRSARPLPAGGAEVDEHGEPAGRSGS